VGLKLKRAHRLLAYADDTNELGDNIETINRNAETFIDATKKVGLEINVEKTKYMLVSRYQNAAEIHDIKIANTSFGNISQFKYFQMTVTNKI
jgi:hypothetical protein